MAESSSVVESLLPDRGTGSPPSNSDQTFARAARSGDMESGHGPKVMPGNILPQSWLRRAVTCLTAEGAGADHFCAGTCQLIFHLLALHNPPSAATSAASQCVQALLHWAALTFAPMTTAVASLSCAGLCDPKWLDLLHLQAANAHRC